MDFEKNSKYETIGQITRPPRLFFVNLSSNSNKHRCEARSLCHSPRSRFTSISLITLELKMHSNVISGQITVPYFLHTRSCISQQKSIASLVSTQNSQVGMQYIQFRICPRAMISWRLCSVTLFTSLVCDRVYLLLVK